MVTVFNFCYISAGVPVFRLDQIQPDEAELL